MNTVEIPASLFIIIWIKLEYSGNLFNPHYRDQDNGNVIILLLLLLIIFASSSIIKWYGFIQYSLK